MQMVSSVSTMWQGRTSRECSTEKRGDGEVLVRTPDVEGIICTTLALQEPESLMTELTWRLFCYRGRTKQVSMELEQGWKHGGGRGCSWARRGQREGGDDGVAVKRRG